MSNEPNISVNDSTKTPDPEIVETDGTLTHPEAPINEGTKDQGSVPSVVALTGKHEDPIPGYQILERLGRGGMGVVHLAKDLHADRLVALKRMLTDAVQGKEVSRFRTEAQSMARLQHPQIVQIYDVSEYQGKPYFTMEYCSGGALDEYLDRKPQTPMIVASIAEKKLLEASTMPMKMGSLIEISNQVIF